MRRKVMGSFFTAILLIAGGTMAQQMRQAQIELQAAIRTETVDGNLTAAIRQYENLIAQYSKDRALVATALVHMAECYQKLGDAESRRLYERVIREYADQTDAVGIAQARLAASGAGGTRREILLRKLYTGAGDYAASISPDGRYLSHVGGFNTAVYLRDLRTGKDRLLTTEGIGGTDRSAISRNGNQIAYDWCNRPGCELRIAELTGTAVPSSRRLYGNQDIFKITPMDWSPDGKQIAVTIRRADGSAQIGVVGVDDGSLRPIKSVEWRGPTKIFFSPDGRDLVYDLPADEETSQRDVFVIAVDGSRETPAVVDPGNDIVMGWSPTGDYLLFASDRSGTMDLWGLPFAERKPRGTPRLLKANIGFVESLGITAAGALYMQTVRASDRDIELLSVDLKSGKPVGVPRRPIQRFAGFNSEPAWSPDGKSLAYMSERGRDEALIVIHTVATGNLRELQLRPPLPWFIGLSWAPDGDSIAVVGDDLKGRHGLFRVDVRTGEVLPIVVPIEREDRLSYEGVSWSRDGKRIYYHSQNGTIRERELESGNERVLIRGQNRNWGPISLSPDERWIASYNSTGAMLIPVQGGEPRELLPIPAGQWINNTAMAWTSDSSALLMRKMTNADGSKSELWLVPIHGEPPRKVDIDSNGWMAYAQGKVRLNPDGQTLAYVTAGDGRLEAWALENFLPAQKP